MNKNKIILSALLSSMFAFNASALTTERVSNDSTSVEMPEEMKDLGQRLSFDRMNQTKLRLRSLFSKTQNVNFRLNYKYWDENTKTLKTAQEKSGGLYPDGRTTDLTLPKNATQVSIKLFGQWGALYPGVSEMRLCAYENPIYELTDPLTSGDNIMEIGFFKNDKNELVAKIGLPDRDKMDQIYFNTWNQYYACKSFPIPGVEDDAGNNTEPGDDPMVQPGYDDSDGPSRR